MNDASPQHLPVVDADDYARRLDVMVNTMAGVLERDSTPLPVSPLVAEVGRLAALVEQLQQRVEALEIELVPLHRSRKCPRCHRLSLSVIATRPHPEFGPDGIEQHAVRCDCGYQGSRLYDPRDFLR